MARRVLRAIVFPHTHNAGMVTAEQCARFFCSPRCMVNTLADPPVLDEHACWQSFGQLVSRALAPLLHCEGCGFNLLDLEKEAK